MDPLCSLMSRMEALFYKALMIKNEYVGTCSTRKSCNDSVSWISSLVNGKFEANETFSTSKRVSYLCKKN